MWSVAWLTLTGVGAKRHECWPQASAGDYKGAQPPYLADKHPEGALSASFCKMNFHFINSPDAAVPFSWIQWVLAAPPNLWMPQKTIPCLQPERQRGPRRRNVCKECRCRYLPVCGLRRLGVLTCLQSSIFTKLSLLSQILQPNVQCCATQLFHWSRNRYASCIMAWKECSVISELINSQNGEECLAQILQ